MGGIGYGARLNLTYGYWLLLANGYWSRAKKSSGTTRRHLRADCCGLCASGWRSSAIGTELHVQPTATGKSPSLPDCLV